MMAHTRSSSIFLVCALFIGCSNFVSCGFAYEKRITGKYYIIGVDTRDEHGLSYNLGGGSFIGRAPGQLIEYGFNDTFLVAKTIADWNARAEYYIIDLSKDSEYAQENIG